MAIRPAAGLALAAGLLCLSGCALRGGLIAPSLQSVELVDTPFYPQRVHECGPAALATVLGASGLNLTPDDLEPSVYLPQKRGSLQIEMLAAPRQYARLTYEIEPELTTVLNELTAGRPVLVLHNYGVSFWPRWHYAVVIGFDSQHGKLILRSGTHKRQVLSARLFMMAWNNGDRWAMVVLRPGELPVGADRKRYLESAASFERVAKPQDAQLAFDAAVKRWPDEPVALVGRGTASYRMKDWRAAAEDYTTALRIDGGNVGARNNLAMTWLEMGCAGKAAEEIGRVDVSALAPALKEAVADTQARIGAAVDPARRCTEFRPK